MLVSPTGLAGTTHPVDEPMPQPPAAAPTAAPSAQVSSTEVLLTTQQVLFSTAAAVGGRRENIGGRLVASMRRMFATPRDTSRPRPQYEPKRYAYLEHAAMARAMHRL
jgi:hypothetical protein